MKLAIVCCLHGNEKYGLKVLNRIPSSLPFFVANKKAIKENKRFIDVDLNRCFPGDKNGNYEEKLAFELTKKLKNFDVVLDLHSSSNRVPIFGIITKPNNEKIILAKKLGLRRLVIMPDFFASGKALIDFVKLGMSIEVGPHERKQNVPEVLNLINNFIQNKNPKINLKIFEIFDVIRGEKNIKLFIKNFKKVKKGDLIAKGKKEYCAEYDFIPVLVGEEAYKEVLCLATRQVNFKSESLLV